TYIPIRPREDSFADIHKNLAIFKEKVKTVVPVIVITEKPNKIYCTRRGVMVKIEVSGMKRGLIDPASIRPLCDAAQNKFETTNKARIVSFSQLYGGKIIAALDRQHPRDLFDVKLMFDFITNFDQIKRGFLYCLLGGDRPIIESLQPNRVDHQETLVKQFAGMTKTPFSYNDYEETREKLIDFINSNLSLQDKEFLIVFEAGEELSRYTEYQEYLRFPSVQWKMQNISKLKKINPAKLRKGVEKLEGFLLQ
ncbi:MAG: nucleotidyl transferase AbiEii/AbiGii toxin family protein, partial [Clostridiaceae bacterium]|nr:nucleotidyl transferase AbiEii/AbiGii toxin family protein [Clostridiaceae bacterium]